MEYTKCNLCGKDNTELVFEAEEQVTSDHTRFRYVKCRNCGLAYINPRPSKDKIGLYYPTETYYTHQPPSKGHRLRRALKKLAIEGLPGYSAHTRAFRRILGKCLGMGLLSQIDIIVPFKEKGRIQDVGCGNGEAIGWMKEYGWELHGSEIGKKACEQAERQGIKTFCGQLHEARYPAEYFDVITINHVLEHIHDPLSMLRECNRILKQDGILIIDVPNFGSFDSELFRENWHALMCPVHLYHFTSDTLNRIINAAGFQVYKRKYKMAIYRYYRANIRNYRSTSPGLLPLCSVLFKASAGAFVKFLLSSNRGPGFSINLITYSSKRD